jgi:hypothetical protein
MSERKELTRREQLIAILRHGGAPCDEVAELVTNNFAAEVRAEQAAEIDRLRARVTELEKAAVEGRAALGSLCYDLEDPGSNAFGALHLLTQATAWTETGPDFAADALARRDADKLDAAAESIEAACPDHGVQDEAWMDCHCVAAEELNRQAEALRKGGAR